MAVEETVLRWHSLSVTTMRRRYNLCRPIGVKFFHGKSVQVMWYVNAESPIIDYAHTKTEPLYPKVL